LTVKPATKSAGTKKPTVITAVTARVGNQGFSTTLIMHNILIDSEFQALIPPLSAEERAQLEANLLADGCRDPLVVWPCATFDIRLDGGATQTLRYEDGRYQHAIDEHIGPTTAWDLDDNADDDRIDEYGDTITLDQWPHILIDGHNRYEICTRLGLPFEVVVKEFDNREAVMDWMDATQLGRRNLHPNNFTLILGRRYNRAKKSIGGTGANQYEQRDQNDPPAKTADKLATEYNVSAATVKRAGQYSEALAGGVKELAAVVTTGAVSVAAAADVATLPAAQQAEIVARGTKEILQAAKEIRAARSEERRTERLEKIVAISTGNAPVGSIAERYPVIYLDPPWRYEHAESESRAIENQYPTMSLEEIKAMDMTKVAFDDCVMFMWATSPKLAEAFEVLDAWGFSYRTCAVWDKQKIGMGYYFRQQHELLLIAVKGQPPTPSPADRPSSVFSYPRGNHSAKPHEVYEIIEAMYPTLPKIEMFCRTPREGWGVWGNQSKAA
jgi:N6-adenosine-specific RNA methylase IME4